MGLNITILPVDTKDLRISPQLTSYDFFSRCKFSTLTTRQLMLDLLTQIMWTRVELTASALAGVQVTYYYEYIGYIYASAQCERDTCSVYRSLETLYEGCLERLSLPVCRR